MGKTHCQTGKYAGGTETESVGKRIKTSEYFIQTSIFGP